MEKEKLSLQHVVKTLISYAREQERRVAPEELDALWAEVEKRTEAERRRKSHRRIFYAAASSAAAIIFCAFLIGRQYISYCDDDSISEFAGQTWTHIPDGGEILLMMPGKKEVEVEQAANIVHSKEGIITVNTDTVGIEEETREKEVLFNQLIIPKGKRTYLTLADGTRLWANAGTRIVYPTRFKKRLREIYIEGEVYLDVARNEKAPFVVKTNDFQIQVLGTSFNVSAYPSENTASVVLVKGSVNVKSKGKEEVTLAPGQLVDIQTGKPGTPRNVNVEPYVCWIRNMLMFADEPLDKVFKKLNLYYGEDFVLGPGVAELRVSGKLDLKEKQEEVLHTISYSAPVIYEEKGGKIYIYRK